MLALPTARIVTAPGESDVTEEHPLTDQVSRQAVLAVLDRRLGEAKLGMATAKAAKNAVGVIEWGKVLNRLGATLEDLRALPATQQPGEGWQDIATAPKDGTPVWAYIPNHFQTSVVFHNDEWRTAVGSLGFVRPTHWQPLPAAPTPHHARQEEER